VKIRQNLLVAALVAAFALGASTSALAADPDQHAPVEPGKLMLNHGKKWATDEPLRQGMGEIRALMTSKLDAVRKPKLTPDEYKVLGAAVEQQVAGIIAQCKLAPEADAVLHLVIADLVAGAATMQGRTKEEPSQGAHKVVIALNSYGHYFDHPGWKAIGGT
jgi:hypothetical protein